MKKSLVIVLVLCVVMMTGCGMGVDLDSKENDLIAEYAAGVMLMHSHYYDDRYDKPWMYDTDNKTEEPTTEEPTTEESTTEDATSEEPTWEGTSEDGNNEEPPTEESSVLDLTEVFGTYPVDVNYVDYTVCESYDVDPEGLFEILPDKGCSFLVLNFTLKNSSLVNQTVSTLDKNIIIRLTINKDEKYNNYDGSMLLNDLTALSDTTLESEEEYKAVILYMIPTEVASNVDSMYIEVASDTEIEGSLVLN